MEELVARLCEAELRSSSEQTCGIHRGGSKTATDAGVDVAVVLKKLTKNSDFVPRKHTIFQVKKHSMPRGKIRDEMQPKGSLRPIIEDLARESGAYIIVSGADNCAKKTLDLRIEAMKAALNKLPNKSKLLVDFYCSSRLATWVNNHFSVALWVREKTDHQLSGWKPYGNWALVPHGVQSKYLLTEEPRLHDKGRDELFPISIGIEKLRESIGDKKSTRLIGLSGMGKTRLVQALFEKGVGTKPLEPSDAVYVDLGDEPNPSAINMLIWLIETKRKAVLIVDNCSPKVHNNLTKQLRLQKSSVSILTVEYDIIDDDNPSETDVYKLHASDERLTSGLLEQHYSFIDEASAKKIIKLSGGNAKIALVLAGTLGPNESVGHLSDTELFDRLFYQRRAVDRGLLEAAQVLSLVYSVSVDSKNTELDLLAGLLDLPSRQLFRQTTELLNRELMQKRSNWRAILPHAIANRLASQALKNIPLQDIEEVFLQSDNERFLKSFSKRISYLSSSKEAQEIVASWMAEGGYLGNPEKYNEAQVSVFCNVALVLPSQALLVLERISDDFLHKQNLVTSDFVDLLLFMVNDEVLFEKAARLLIMFAKAELPEANYSPARTKLARLYSFSYSNSEAITGLKLKLIHRLTMSPEPENVSIGLEFLSTALHSQAPKVYLDTMSKRGNANTWISKLIDIAIGLIQSENKDIAAKVRSIVSQNFWSLCVLHEASDSVKRFCLAIRKQQFWGAGWVAAKGVLSSDSDQIDGDCKAHVINIVEILAPVNLAEEAKLYALNSPYGLFEYNRERYTEDMAQVVRYTSELGYRVAKEGAAIFDELLPDLVSADVTNAFYFGRGLAKGSDNLRGNWQKLIDTFVFIKSDMRKFSCIAGYFSVLREADLGHSEEWLDFALNDSDLMQLFFRLQCSAKLDQSGYERLLKALNNDQVPAEYLKNVTNVSLNDTKLAGLLTKLLDREEGELVALEIWSDRFGYSNKNKFEESLLVVGREITRRCLIIGQCDIYDEYSLDSKLSVIIKDCIPQTSYRESLEIFQLLKVNLDLYWGMHFSKSARVFAAGLPSLFLDTFLEQSDYKVYEGSVKNAFLSISNRSVISWCEVAADTRFLRVAELVSPFKKDHLSELAKQLILSCPNREALLDIFIASCSLSNYSEHPFHSNTQKRSVLSGFRKKLQHMLDDELAASVVTKIRNEIIALENKEDELLLLGDNEDIGGEQKFEW